MVRRIAFALAAAPLLAGSAVHAQSARLTNHRAAPPEKPPVRYHVPLRYEDRVFVREGLLILLRDERSSAERCFDSALRSLGNAPSRLAVRSAAFKCGLR